MLETSVTEVYDLPIVTVSINTSFIQYFFNNRWIVFLYNYRVQV